ncbi:MAG TPA: hypothetical protein VGC06_08450 [Actinomycetes bacterium]
MSDDQPRAPTYGPPITIPGARFLGLVAYNAWCAARLDDPEFEWREPSEAERAMWQRIAMKVAEAIRDATERSHALGNNLPPPRCPAKRRDRSTDTLYICCRWDPHPADQSRDLVVDDEGHRWVPVEP